MCEPGEEPLPRYHLTIKFKKTRGWHCKVKRLIRVSLLGGVALYFASTLSCGGVNFGEVQPQDLCKCVPLEPPIADFRHYQKHVPIPNMTPIETTVDTILSWTQDVIVLPDAPRTGRELQVFHVAQAFLQNVSVNGEDCDVDLEISQTADRNAPRVIVETPGCQRLSCWHRFCSLKPLQTSSPILSPVDMRSNAVMFAGLVAREAFEISGINTIEIDVLAFNRSRAEHDPVSSAGSKFLNESIGKLT
jgi:hypothetical protein